MFNFDWSFLYGPSLYRYCLETIAFDASLANWVCYECLQKRGEVTCSRSQEIVSSERPPSHAHSDSTLHEPVTRRVDLSSGVGLWTNRKLHMVNNKSLNKRFPSSLKASRMKPFKRKPIMRPMDSCPYKRGLIATNTDHAKSLQSCETIVAQKAKGNIGRNQHDENDTVALYVMHPSPLIVNCLGDSNQFHHLKGIEQLSNKWKDPQSRTKNVVLGSKKLDPSNSTAEHEKSVLEKYGDTSNGMMDTGANISAKNIDHDNPSNELRQRNMVADIPQFSLQNSALDNVMLGASNDGCQKALSCTSTKNIPGVQETNVHPVNVSSSSQHGNTESSESSKRFVGCQKGSFCHRGKRLKVATTSTSLEASGKSIIQVSCIFASKCTYKLYSLL
jgi:hypothetical protein